MSEDIRTYTIVVDLAAARGQSPLDALQRIGVGSLLRCAVPVAMRQEAVEAQRVEIDVSFGGAVVVLQFRTTSLETAEWLAGVAVAAALRVSPYLSAWRVVSSEARLDLLWRVEGR